jgi:fructokinase
MKKRREKGYDVLCIGELLVDLMTTDYADKLDGKRLFRPLPGGSPANLSMNLARLGNRSTLVASVGNDGIGDFLLDFVGQLDVDCQYIIQMSMPSTLILVTQSLNLPSFEVYRCADQYITSDQLPDSLLSDCSIFHTTCFALSKEPARTTILRAAAKAHEYGSQLSIDMNYATKVWPDRKEAQKIVEKYCSLNPIVKISEVDWERLYGQPLNAPEQAIEHFVKLGAKEVCVTLGAEGCYVGNKEKSSVLPAQEIEVRDTTGAGDAFWSGYLTAWLDGHNLENCAKAGRQMAGLKLSSEGVLPKQLDRKVLYQEFAIG